MPKKITIQNISVETDSIQISYLAPSEDVKSNGVVHVHSLIIPVGADYDDEIEALLSAAKHCVLDVLDDLPRLVAGAAPRAAS